MADEMIPLFRPSCTDLEIRYVTEALRSGWWGTGPRTAELEEQFAAMTGTLHAVAVNSCSMALQLALEGLGIRGKKVILPALTFAATGLAVLHSGNTPVFADVSEDALCLDWDDAAYRVTPRTGAVIPVWYGGSVTPAPRGYAEAFQGGGILVIEDCAHAAGSARAGQQGDVACWSFQAVKNLSSADGGMITTGDYELAKRLRRLRWCGIDRDTWDRDEKARSRAAGYNWEYEIAEAGHKAAMNDVTAALALAQLERLEEMNAARRVIALAYLDGLAGLGWLELPAWRDGSSWHLFVIRVPEGCREGLIAHMASLGVSAGVHYRPLTSYEVFAPYKQDLPVTDRVWRTLVTLPLFADMTPADVLRVIEAVRSFRGFRLLR